MKHGCGNGVIVVLVVLAILALYPLQEKREAGIDLAGGSVLIYDRQGGCTDQEKYGLAERRWNILKGSRWT
ncbi:MAG: hypothetical protein H6816_08280 [Phycisphaerales bacterium]|nr:hypothetical protein [Phycisphaerales bacterium]